jgi:hypothetical protein
MAYSPDAIQACFDTVNAAMPQAELGGIYANKPGYHNSRNQLPGSDYSVQQPYDKQGDGDAASALDLTLRDQGDIKRLTQRLVDETAAHGDTGRLRALREFIGTLDGSTCRGMDVPGRYWFTSQDMTHLWHIHMSGKRSHSNDRAAWLDVAAVLLDDDTAGETEDDDMPDNVEVQLTSPVELAASDPQELVFSKVVTDAANLWGDNPDTSKGYLSMRIGGRKFVSTFTATVVDAPEDTTVLTSLEFLNSSGQVSRTLQWRETTGQGYIYLGDSRAGYVSTGGVARVVVQASRPCTLKAAGWSVLAW